MIVNGIGSLPAANISATPSYGETIEKKDFERCLETAVNEKNNKKLYSACQELESVFLNKLLETMRQSISRSDFTGHSFATETFESMLYTEYSRTMSQTNSIGIADILYRQLNGDNTMKTPL